MQLGPTVVTDGVEERQFDLESAGRRIPGLLWTPPQARGTRPLVLIGHGASGSKREGYVVALARRLVRAHGYAAAAIDGPVHGDRRPDGGSVPGLPFLEFSQVWSLDPTMTDAMVADWRATLDALRTLDEVGEGAVGWWGLSMGTILGLPLVAADERIRAAVLGLMGLTGPSRARIEADAPRVRCPVLFLMQWDDELFTRQAALELFDRLGTADKRLVVHTGGHGQVPPEGFETSERFLARHLGS
jgi:dienelactone hydrolase